MTARSDINKKLSLYAYGYSFDMVKLLLKQGADIETKNGCGRTPLHIASKSDNITMVKLLLKHRANIEATDIRNETPLHLASNQHSTSDYEENFEQIQIVKLLLEYGANTEAINKYRETPLFISSDSEHIEITKLLLEHGANIHNGYNNDPIIIKARKCREHMIKLKEWRPWNHTNYPSRYRSTMKTLLLLSKI